MAAERKADGPPHSGAGGGQTAGMGGNSGGRAGGDRPQRTAHTDFITPKYSWDQARFSDFGISGGIFNALKGVYQGNTYAGRTPQGFGNHNLKDNGGKTPYVPDNATLQQMRQLLTGGQYSNRTTPGGLPPALPPGPMAQAPVAPPPGPMMQMAPKPLSVGGGLPYGVTIPGYTYR